MHGEEAGNYAYGMWPMMGKGMMGGMDKPSDKAQDTTPVVAGEVDHASHH